MIKYLKKKQYIKLELKRVSICLEEGKLKFLSADRRYGQAAEISYPIDKKS